MGYTNDFSNTGKNITLLSKEHDFNEVFEIFEDIVYEPSRENITNILLEYEKNNDKTLYGYFLYGKLVGIIGIKDNRVVRKLQFLNNFLRKTALFYGFAIKNTGLVRQPTGLLNKSNIENVEILHFGIHPEYRGKQLGTELMDFIKNKGTTMVLSTDDDAIKFYEKYGFKHTKYFNEKYQKIRYDCIYEQ